MDILLSIIIIAALVVLILLPLLFLFHKLLYVPPAPPDPQSLTIEELDEVKNWTKRALKNSSSFILSDEIIEEAIDAIVHKKEHNFIKKIKFAPHIKNGGDKFNAVRELTGTIDTFITRMLYSKKGHKYYVWESCSTCPQHAVMNNVIIDWEKEPTPEKLSGSQYGSRYHAGTQAGCYCRAVPLTPKSKIKKPYKFFDGNNIVVINGKKLKEMMH